MIIQRYQYPEKKFRTVHRDDMYHEIRAHDRTGLFSEMVDLFLMSFAIGFHRGVCKTVSGPDAINHVNNSAVSSTNQDLIILLMLDRHPELQSREDLWKLVEAYAEGGIEILYDSLYRNEWILDIDDILA